MPEQVKALHIKPAVGNGVDARSNADEVDYGTYRYALNWGTTSKGKLCRIPGWDKLLTKSDYNNQDLHDQLQNLTGFPSRLPITFLFEAISSRKSTKLICGTSIGLYALNTSTGNWKILSDRLGSQTSNTRWRAGQLSDTVILSNNFDPVQYWLFDQGATEPNDQSVAPINDLLKFGLTKAGVVIVWQDHVFAMNTVVNGSVQSMSIYWSNFQRPLDWIPNIGSTAGNADLPGFGEVILAAIPLADRLLIFTNKSIWECFAGGDSVFSFNRRYAPVDSEACLFYPNTLVSKGDELVYGGKDGIYTYSLYQVKPQRVEWIHNVSSLMYDFINESDCLAHNAAYNAQRKEILVSFAKNDETIPSATLVINAEYPWGYILDHGFSAMVNYTLKTQTETIRDFLLTYCVCEDSGLTTYWNQFVKEGGFCTAQETITCNTIPTSICTTNPKTITYDGESVETEDFDQETCDSNSLCGVLGSLTLSHLCESESRQDECNAGLRFVVASSADYCLKEFSQNYYREQVTGFTGCGATSKKGYRSLLRSGPISAGDTEVDKRATRFEIEATAPIQGTPSQWGLRIGQQGQAVDPNFDDCGIVWDEQEPKNIECLSHDTVAGHVANKTTPDDSFKWPIFYYSKYIYFELSVINPNVDPVDTGGATCLSRITMDITPVTVNY